MRVYFGTSQEYFFYPVSNGRDPHVLPDSPGNIYLFDSEPTIDDAMNGTEASANLLATISSWTNTPDGFGKRFTIPAQADPDPDGSVFSYSYFLAINTKAVQGDVTTHAPIIKEVVFTRLRTQEGALVVTNGDLKAVEPSIKKFICNSELEDYIDSAIDEVRDMFDGHDTTFGDIWNPAPLNKIVKHLAISNFAFGQSRGTGSMEFALYLKHKEKYETALKDVRLLLAKPTETKPERKIEGAAVGYFDTLRFQ